MHSSGSLLLCNFDFNDRGEDVSTCIQVLSMLTVVPRQALALFLFTRDFPTFIRRNWEGARVV